MRVARVQAQAKINLMLRIFPTRDVRGYHELLTYFHRIDLSDGIVIRVGGSGRSIDCSGPQFPSGGLGPPEENLAYRAAVEFANRCGWPQGFAIELTKRIPVGGGLGGGSADAGAVLRALNAIAPRPISSEEIWSAGCFLGSDVPFLASEHVSALGSGRGTQLSHGSNRPWSERQLLVVVPPFSIATADAYRWLDDDREGRGFSVVESLLEPVQRLGEAMRSESTLPLSSRHLLDATMTNDFEPVVESRHPDLRKIRERLLEKGAGLARLAGSGSCVFGIFEHTPPSTLDLDFESILIPTRLSSRVVQVEVLE